MGSSTLAKASFTSPTRTPLNDKRPSITRSLCSQGRRWRMTGWQGFWKSGLRTSIMCTRGSTGCTGQRISQQGLSTERKPTPGGSRTMDKTSLSHLITVSRGRARAPHQGGHSQITERLTGSIAVDIINVVSVTAPVTVNQWYEENDDDVQDSLYWRQALDIRTNELSVR